MCFFPRCIFADGVFLVSVDPLDSQLAGGKDLCRSVHGRVVEKEEEVGRNTNLIPLAPDQEGQLRNGTRGFEFPLVFPELKMSMANLKSNSFSCKPVEEVFGGRLLNGPQTPF
ncbi:hypothetical protein OOU_Y34scaffold00765g103 [Pyricularia oryzae Y34]|nr:hypothetical protein OOU_Y34scaffold00765g103 [Pyricularia oryzae Y34]